MTLKAIIKSSMIQTHHTNKKRKISPTLDVGEFKYLSMKNLTLQKGQARKLLPKYIGPMRVIGNNLEVENYTLPSMSISWDNTSPVMMGSSQSNIPKPFTIWKIQTMPNGSLMR